MAGSGFIRKPRSSTPKPSSKMNIPAKKQSKMSSMRFSDEELSRRAKGSKILHRPSR